MLGASGVEFKSKGTVSEDAQSPASWSFAHGLRACMEVL